MSKEIKIGMATLLRFSTHSVQVIPCIETHIDYPTIINCQINVGAARPFTSVGALKRITAGKPRGAFFFIFLSCFALSNCYTMRLVFRQYTINYA